MLVGQDSGSKEDKTQPPDRLFQRRPRGRPRKKKEELGDSRNNSIFEGTENGNQKQRIDSSEGSQLTPKKVKLGRRKRISLEGREKPKPYCGMCKQDYSCSSAFYLHIRTKHEGIQPEGSIGGPRGTVVLHPRKEQPDQQEDDGKQEFVQYSNCICGKIYSCKSALSYHVKQKHGNNREYMNSTTVKVAFRKKGKCITYNSNTCQFFCQCGLILNSPLSMKVHISRNHRLMNRKYMCQCGRSYATLAARNVHLKRKNASGSCSKQNNTTQVEPNQVYGNSNSSQSGDEEDEEVFTKEKEGKKYMDASLKSIYRCGDCCARYSCSSSFYLHLRKKHQGLTPNNSIVGPRGAVINGVDKFLTMELFYQIVKPKEYEQYQPVRLNEKLSPEELQQHTYYPNPVCLECSLSQNGDIYFTCLSCKSIIHTVCFTCFWQRKHIVQGHEEWIVSQPLKLPDRKDQKQRTENKEDSKEEEHCKQNQQNQTLQNDGHPNDGHPNDGHPNDGDPDDENPNDGDLNFVYKIKQVEECFYEQQ